MVQETPAVCQRASVIYSLQFIYRISSVRVFLCVCARDQRDQRECEQNKISSEFSCGLPSSWTSRDEQLARLLRFTLYVSTHFLLSKVTHITQSSRDKAQAVKVQDSASWRPCVWARQTDMGNRGFCWVIVTRSRSHTHPVILLRPDTLTWQDVFEWQRGLRWPAYRIMTGTKQ